jgi:hypothetical protein
MGCRDITGDSALQAPNIVNGSPYPQLRAILQDHLERMEGITSVTGVRSVILHNTSQYTSRSRTIKTGILAKRFRPTLRAQLIHVPIMGWIRHLTGPLRLHGMMMRMIMQGVDMGGNRLGDTLNVTKEAHYMQRIKQTHGAPSGETPNHHR